MTTTNAPMNAHLAPQAKSIMAITLLVTLISVSGIALPYPMLAPLFQAGTHPLTHFMSLPTEILFGIVIGIYPLGVIIGSSFIGTLSDQYGRKKVLTFTMLGSTFSYLLTGFSALSGDFLLFVFARFLTGLLEGNIAIARAIATDLHPSIDKTKSLSWVNAMTFAGYLIGPLTGGQLASLGVDVVFYWAALACFIATLLCLFTLPNTLNRKADNAETGSSLQLLKDNALRHYFFLYLLLMIGINIFYEFYPLWLVEKFSFNAEYIAWSTVFITSSMIVTSFFAIPILTKRLSKAQGGLLGMMLVSVSMFFIPSMEDYFFLLIFMVVGMGVAIYNGFLTSYISTSYEHRPQGKLMGMLVTIFCVGNLIAAGLGSILSYYEVNYALFASAICSLCACILFYRGHFHLALWQRSKD
ncbi:MAG: MFS transporter [Parashewanella sp.]